jgi:hypothetical protein
MTVADVQHGDPGKEVQVLVTIRIPEAATLPAHELHGAADIGRDRIGALERLQLL